MTSIEWCDRSFNPWIGCSKVAAGCQNCYAEKNVAVTMGVGRGSWGPSGTRYVTSESNWKKPLAWAKKARKALDDCYSNGGDIPHRPRVFCASLADVFEDRPELAEPRDRLIRLIDKTPELDWLVLSKRPWSMRKYVCDRWGIDGSSERMPNLWLGTSIAGPDDLDNIWELARVPAAVRFVSYEPAIAGVDLRPFLHRYECTECGARGDGDSQAFESCEEQTIKPKPAFDWLIVGGESGPKARPFDVAWIRSAVEQCKAAQVPCFVKQMGRGASMHTDEGRGFHHNCDGEFAFITKDKKGGEPSEWPKDLRVREFPHV